jgi:ABC-type multidrug transport system ATPase subunit
MLLDEISTGLDSSTTRMITQCLRNLAHIQQVSKRSLFPA